MNMRGREGSQAVQERILKHALNMLMIYRSPPQDLLVQSGDSLCRSGVPPHAS